jgi:hypothetical protein
VTAEVGNDGTLIVELLLRQPLNILDVIKELLIPGIPLLQPDILHRSGDATELISIHLQKLLRLVKDALDFSVYIGVPGVAFFRAEVFG